MRYTTLIGTLVSAATLAAVSAGATTPGASGRTYVNSGAVATPRADAPGGKRVRNWGSVPQVTLNPPGADGDTAGNAPTPVVPAPAPSVAPGATASSAAPSAGGWSSGQWGGNPAKPAPAKPAPVQPTSAKPAPQSASAQSASAQSASTKPAPTKSAPVQPAPAEPAPAQPTAQPASVQSASAKPAPVRPVRSMASADRPRGGGPVRPESRGTSSDLAYNDGMPSRRHSPDRWRDYRDGGGRVYDGRDGGYVRPMRGYRLPPFFVTPRFRVIDWGRWRLARPPIGYNWIRYYDDAVLIDARGNIYDTAYDLDWDRDTRLSAGDYPDRARPEDMGPPPQPYYDQDPDVRVIRGSGVRYHSPAAPGTTIVVIEPGVATTTTTTTYVE